MSASIVADLDASTFRSGTRPTPWRYPFVTGLTSFLSLPWRDRVWGSTGCGGISDKIQTLKKTSTVVAATVPSEMRLGGDRNSRYSVHRGNPAPIAQHPSAA